MGVDKYIDEQLHPDRIADATSTPGSASSRRSTLSSRTLAERYEVPAMQARRERQKQGGDKRRQAGRTGQGRDQAQTPPPQPDPTQQRAALPLLELSEQKMIRAVYSDRQLEEVLTDFWFNHFNVDARKGPERFMLTEYERDAIRPHVLGRFRDLLGATAKSPAMLFYLDNWMSADPNGPHLDRARASGPAIGRSLRSVGARGPVGRAARRAAPPQAARKRPTGLNENYGRELLELHTLGVDGGYTQKDVTEVARAFTGWTIANAAPRRRLPLRAALHDDGEKIGAGAPDQGRRRRARRRGGARHLLAAIRRPRASSRPSWRGDSSATRRRRRWSIGWPRRSARPTAICAR